MTDKEKLKKIKMLADAMYNRMQNLTTDTSGIRKAMYDYHQFIINEYYKEEPESKDLEDEIDIYTEYLDPKDIKNAPFAHIEECARHFAKWQKEQIIDKACEWLLNHTDYICSGTNGSSFFNIHQLVNDLKKAMEEQQ